MGYLIEPENIDLLAFTMQMMIENVDSFNKEYLHKYAIEHFSEDVIRKELEVIYSGCITGGVLNEC